MVVMKSVYAINEIVSMTLPADDGDCLDDEFDAVINATKKGLRKSR